MAATLAPALRVLEGRAIAARRTFRSVVVSNAANPLLYLLAVGYGVGAVVDPGEAAGLPGGSYLAFLAPGLMVAVAMQLAAAESLWPVMVGLEWQKTYHATIATPVRPRDIVLGHLGWVICRAVLAGAIIGVVIVVFGVIEPLRALVAIPVGVLVATAFAGPIATFTALVRNGEALTTLFRFAIIPLFLFSGTFFPIDRLPDAVQPIAAVSPLWHGAELARLAALGAPTTWPAAAHLAVLAGLTVVGGVAAARVVGRVLRR
ncbi:ABC transporter [Egibacter rhizosphaerae]|uniref:Transport permease protein n=1 Tax=Egibacter rhizosphaerae TaxID=1670831 RepID=A0A411YER5_9ACTN|nr:ABC transporter permease [Egibacter rhizosphaerae]QBI19754.1 ABC transporter [Egibacter rhizosphaerae]